MEGIVKEVKKEEPEQPKQAPVEQKSISTMTWEGVPIDFYRHFGVDISNTSDKVISRLKSIFEWSLENLDEKTLGNALQKVSIIERKLGSPHIDETREERLYRWIKIQKIMNEMRNRQKSMERGIWA